MIEKTIIKEVQNIEPHLKNKLNMKKNTTFGVEIEAEDINPMDIIKNNKNIENWIFKDDRSLKLNKSIELVSPILNNNRICYLEIKKACNLLKNSHANVNDNSSLQIHYGSQIFNEKTENLKQFYKLWAIFEHIIYRYSYGINNKPRNTIYCYARPIAIYLKNVLEKDDIESKDILNLSRLIGALKQDAISFRYKEINDQIKINTIEIRTINGTLDYLMIQRYINFFYHLLSYPTAKNFDKEKINYLFNNIDKQKYLLINYTNLYIDDALELSNMIFTDEIDKLLFLKDYLKDDIKILTK